MQRKVQQLYSVLSLYNEQNSHDAHDIDDG